MLFRSLFQISALAAQTSATIYYAGVAESGGEFGVYSNSAINGTSLPGRFGVDYAFINKSTVDIFLSQGVNLFRVAFLLERMCPLEYGLGSRFNETYYRHFNDAITYIAGKGAYAILDPHNYMRYTDQSQQPGTGSVIGNSSDPAAASTAQFQAFRAELVSRYVKNEKVIYGIMNEPHDMPTSLVLTNDQAAINGIRSSGAKQLIIAPGNGYTGGHAWNTTSQGDAPSGEYLYKLTDPLNNTGIDIHEYLDLDFSGGHNICSTPYQEYLAYLTGWLKKHKFKAMITKFGGSSDPSCKELIRSALHYLHNHEEYIGWSAWAAGPLWGSQSLCCDNQKGDFNGSLEPGSTSLDGGPGFYQEVWQKVIQPKLPLKHLQKSGISNLHGTKGVAKFS